jgi:Protein of unknown function (DUF3435)
VFLSCQLGAKVADGADAVFGQTAGVTGELQNVMLQHANIDTFVRHYSVGIHVAAQAIVHGLSNG